MSSCSTGATAWPAWEGENPLIEGLAPSLIRVHQRADALMKEIDPAQTTELIDRYETVYGLPDSCTRMGCNRWSASATSGCKG